MASVTRRPEAEADVIDIWGFIAEDSIAQADRWVDLLDERLQLWATQPMIGRARDELTPGIRSMAFGRYIVFFAPVDGGIDRVVPTGQRRQAQRRSPQPGMARHGPRSSSRPDYGKPRQEVLETGRRLKATTPR